MRLRVTDAADALVAGDFALGGNWGTGPSISNLEAGSTDAGGRVQINSGSGAPGANPTVTLTLGDPIVVGRQATRPKVVCNAPFLVSSKTVVGSGTDTEKVTAIVFQFNGTPAVSTAYQLEFLLAV
jgi:hypothetical protein